MSKQIKKLVSLLLLLTLFVTMLPITALAASNPVTIRVQDEDGNSIEGATITGTYKGWFGSSQNISSDDIVEQGNGDYIVYLNSNNNFFYTFTLTVSADGYESNQTSFSGNQSSAKTVALTAIPGTEPEVTEPVTTEPPATEPPATEPPATEPPVTEPETTEPETTEPGTTENPNAEWKDFKMYYYINGSEANPFPPSYAGSSAAGNFGPSGDDTPFVTVSIDINKLKTQYSDVAVYQDGSAASSNSNSWQFIPGTSAPNLEDARAFWAAVMDCMSAESVEAFEATGISDYFIGYALKSISYGSSNTENLHLDGILKVTPPVYSIELYIDEVTTNESSNYVGGMITNKGETFPTIHDVLGELEEHLGYPVTWDEDENGNPILTNNTYTGSYIHGDHKHAITVEQTHYNQTQAVDGSEIRYQQKSSYYYVTYFVMTVDEEEPMSFTVTYTDGEANKASFKDHSYGISKLENETVYAPVFPYAPTWEGHLFKGWLQEGGDGTLLTTEQIGQIAVEQNLVFHAQWQELFSVYFHANNSASDTADVFRTYRSHASMVQAGDYLLNNGAVGVFYDIPTFAYDVHNGYIFKGWYMGTGENAAPMDWNASYTGETHIYAHWIQVGAVAKENDGKRYESDTYPEYDLLGNQIRVATENPGEHYGDAAPGLRFIASLSERVYAELNGLHTNNGGGVEYGFLLARADAVNTADMLKYKHASLNGEDTTSSHAYVNNVPCRVAGRPVDDHYAGETYRLYTAVITYRNLTGDTLTAAQNTNFVGRAYIRYFDANGLERVHYNNYTGEAKTCGGVNTCYAQVQALLNSL